MNNHEQLQNEPAPHITREIGNSALSSSKIDNNASDTEPKEHLGLEALYTMRDSLEELKKDLQNSRYSLVVDEHTRMPLHQLNSIRGATRRLALENVAEDGPILRTNFRRQTLEAPNAINSLLDDFSRKKNTTVAELGQTIRLLERMIADLELVVETFEDPAHKGAFNKLTISVDTGQKNPPANIDSHMNPVIKKLAKQRSNPPLIDPSAPEPLNFPESVDNGL